MQRRFVPKNGFAERPIRTDASILVATWRRACLRLPFLDDERAPFHDRSGRLN
jgi:hypothetical protein